MVAWRPPPVYIKWRYLHLNVESVVVFFHGVREDCDVIHVNVTDPSDMLFSSCALLKVKQYYNI